MRLEGLIAAPHTPFDQHGQLWIDAIDQQARFLADQPVNGVFIGGSTGECTSLSIDERIQLCDRWVRSFGPSGKQIVVHVGTNCIPDSVELAAHAASLNVDGFAAFAPSYFRPTSVDALIEFLKPIALAAESTPFYFYDIPVLTRVELSMLDFLERAPIQIPNLNGLKYTNSNLVQLRECMDRFGDQFDFVFGCDEILMAGLSMGIRGAIGSTYNFAAPLYQKIITALQDGDNEAAREAQTASVKLVDALSDFDFISASKAAMKIVGVDCGNPRPPLKSLNEQKIAALHRELAALHLVPGCESATG